MASESRINKMEGNALNGFRTTTDLGAKNIGGDLEVCCHKNCPPCRLDEFVHLENLGEGAYGDVVKVHNKLDDKIYAIKRIKLKPHNNKLNQRITREVKFLSGLNHENVVRYYASWIERADKDLSESETSSQTTSSAGSEDDVTESVCLYIQMEFCEKETLRTAIDHGLCQDEDRVWRLFHEIVEGLAHIHQQGMIHRDLKPPNIFLDSRDHVKIGDFGLSTMDILPGAADKEKQRSMEGIQLLVESREDVTNQLTAGVGTPLYIAPEVGAAPKINEDSFTATYNQKADIYSLGIILFEMCYPPISTRMERIEVLENLRSEGIAFPSDFPQSDMPKLAHLIRWLLNHNPELRPSSQELLEQLGDQELKNMVQETLSNPQSKAYEGLISLCFMQKMNRVEDKTFDESAPTNGPCFQQHLSQLTRAKSVVEDVFQLHGASWVETPLFMPQSTPKCEDSTVHVMTRSGSIVSVPHDLRANFAHYVIRNGVTCLRRYATQRVYRQLRGVDPQEIHECSFDIVNPNCGGLLPDAEVITIVCKAIRKLFEMRKTYPVPMHNITLLLSHTALLPAALVYCGVSEDQHTHILSLYREAKDLMSLQFQLEEYLGETKFRALFNLFRVGQLSDIASALRDVAKQDDRAQQGLRELRDAIKYTRKLGVKFQILVTSMMLNKTDMYSGVVCQFIYNIKNKAEVFAVSGRYPESLFRQTLDRTGMLSHVTAVGVNLCLDKVVTFLHDCGKVTSVDVVVWLSDQGKLQDAAQIETDLMNARIRCHLFDKNQTMLEKYCQTNSIRIIINVRDADSYFVKVWTLNDEFGLCEVVEARRSYVIDFIKRSMGRRQCFQNETQNIFAPGTSRRGLNLERCAGRGRGDRPEQVATELQPSPSSIRGRDGTDSRRRLRYRSREQERGRRRRPDRDQHQERGRGDAGAIAISSIRSRDEDLAMIASSLSHLTISSCSHRGRGRSRDHDQQKDRGREDTGAIVISSRSRNDDTVVIATSSRSHRGRGRRRDRDHLYQEVGRGRSHDRVQPIPLTRGEGAAMHDQQQERGCD